MTFQEVDENKILASAVDAENNLVKKRIGILKLRAMENF
jgi:hypothetical protein